MSYLRIHFQIQDHEILVQFFKKSLITLAITFNSLIHVEIIFVYCEVRMEESFDSPLDGKEVQPVHPKGDHSWVFIGKIDVEAEIPILWPPDVRS